MVKKIRYRVCITSKRFKDVLLKPVEIGNEIEVDNELFTVRIISKVNMKGIPKKWLGVSKGWKCKMRALVHLFPMNTTEPQYLDCILNDGHRENHAFVSEDRSE